MRRLGTRDVEGTVLPALRELGIGFVAYSPIGRGFLPGTIPAIDSLPLSDWRPNNPRFTGANFDHNLGLVRTVQRIAVTHHATAAQVALAWLLRQGTAMPRHLANGAHEDEERHERASGEPRQLNAASDDECSET